MTKRALTPACLLLALAATGCGPATSGSGGPAPSPTPQRQGQAALAAQPGVGAAEKAISRFSQTFINWHMPTLSDTKRKLAAMATGDLRTQLTTEATQAANNEALSQTTGRNSGTVEAITVRKDKPVIVVTHETATLGDGRASQSGYFVYLVTAKRTASGWKISGFQPATS
jgi:hypothetical protein